MLIGLTGRKRSGKSTVARILTERGFIEQSFADPIRGFTCNLLNMTPEELDRAKESPIDWLGGTTPRHIMQTLGTEWGRDSIDPDLWIKALHLRVEPLLAAGQCVVVSDLRFDNEARAVRALGGRVVRVERPSAAYDPHRSEAGVSGHLIDFSLHNDGGIIELASAVDLLVDATRRLEAARLIT